METDSRVKETIRSKTAADRAENLWSWGASYLEQRHLSRLLNQKVHFVNLLPYERRHRVTASDDALRFPEGSENTFNIAQEHGPQRLQQRTTTQWSQSVSTQVRTEGTRSVRVTQLEHSPIALLTCNPARRCQVRTSFDSLLILQLTS